MFLAEEGVGLLTHPLAAPSLPPPNCHRQGPAGDTPKVEELRGEVPAAAAPGRAADGA